MSTVGGAVKITNFKVPSSYLIEDEENPGTLILDCEYKFESGEVGIVVSWWLNDTRIYQWIPNEKKPSPPSVTVSIFKEKNDLKLNIQNRFRYVAKRKENSKK